MSVVFIVNKNYNNECKSYKDNFIIIRIKIILRSIYLICREREKQRGGEERGV